MIQFERLLIGNDPDALSGGVRPCPRCLRMGSITRATQLEAAGFEQIRPAIKILAARGASAMLYGYEPFRHPDLVDIIHALREAESDPAGGKPSRVRRIGMRSDAAALVNPQDARGCIDLGVRVFEIPLLTPDMDALSTASPTEASLAGIAGIRAAARALGKPVFICIDLVVCKHTAPQFEQAAQAGLAAGVDALRISFDPGLDASRIEGLPAAIAALQARATQSSMALFGDGCKEFLKGARLYEY